MSSPVIRKYALGLLFMLFGTGLQSILCQQTTPEAKRSQATLTIRVQVQPVIGTSESRQAEKAPDGASITYNFPRPMPRMTSVEETVTMTDESGHKYPVRRTTVVEE